MSEEKPRPPKQPDNESPVVNEEYIVQPVDVGKNLIDIVHKAQNAADHVLSEEERALLDSLLVNNFAEKSYFLSEGFPVVFRTVSGEGVQNLWKVLSEITSDKHGTPRMVSNYVNFVQVATYLVGYGSSDFRVPTQDAFESVEEIKKRVSFVSKLSAILIDRLLDLRSSFVQECEKTLQVVKVENFSKTLPSS